MSRNRVVALAVVSILLVALLAAVTGRALVNPETSPAPGTTPRYSADVWLTDTLTTCGQDIKCFETALTRLHDERGIAEAAELFKLINTKTGNMNGRCTEVGSALGVLGYRNDAQAALDVHSDSCGRSMTYATVAEAYRQLGGSTETDQKMRAYCLGDTNAPSCFYGVGLALNVDGDEARSAQARCATLGTEYDSTHSEPVSYQWTAVGDCLIGWLNSPPVMQKYADAQTLDAALELCDGLTNRAADLCLGSTALAYVQHAPGGGTAERLSQVQTRCANTAAFECSQFLGKALEIHLSNTYPAATDTEQRSAASFAEPICSSVNLEGCVTGIVQQRATRNGHDATAPLCRAFKGVRAREFCLTTSSNHA